eukprot:SAG31_NODE_47_length_30979_cov_41.708841_7_plen_83_part_00
MLWPLLCVLMLAVARSDAHSLETLEKLKAELHTLTPAQADARIAELGPSPSPPRQDKIDNFVVLFMVRAASRSERFYTNYNS